MAAVHGLRVLELQRNAREGVRQQDRRSCRPAGMAGRLCQVRQGPGLHGHLTVAWRLPLPWLAPSSHCLERGFMSTLVNAAPEVATRAPRRSRLTAAKRRQYGAAYTLVYAGYLSFYRKRLIGGTSFAGAENYIKALTDPLFLSGVGRMAIFLVVQVPFMIAFALFFALALDSGMMRLARFSRLAIFVPYAVPGVVATLMWG